MVFLTELEKEKFSEYKTKTKDGSIVNLFLGKLLDIAVNFIPEYVAPNVLSLASCLFLVQSFYLCQVHGDNFPQLTNAAALFFIGGFYILDALDSKHAIRTGNDNSLVEFFDHICSSIGSIFFALTLGYVLGIRDTQTLWYCVQAGQLIILHKHVGGFVRDELRYRLFNGPGEVISLSLLVLLIRLVLGTKEFDYEFEKSRNSLIQVFESFLKQYDLYHQDYFLNDKAKTINGNYLLSCIIWYFV